jgi:hypothetical protein
VAMYRGGEAPGSPLRREKRRGSACSLAQIGVDDGLRQGGEELVDLLVPWRRLERSGEREGAGSRLARAEERRAGCGGVGPVRRGAPPPLEERRRCLKRRGTARER